MEGRGRGYGRQFKPGQSGNPNGRPRDPLKQAIQAELAKTASARVDGRVAKGTKNQIVAKAMVSAAIAGNVRAAEFIADRAFGRAAQPLDIVGEMDVAYSGNVGVTIEGLHEIIRAEKAKRAERASAKAATNVNGKKH